MDLLSLERDPGYDEFMRAAWLSQQKSLLTRAIEKRSMSPFLRSIAGEAGAKELLDEVRVELLELGKRGVKSLSVREKFERAGQLDYYEGPYSDLSWNTHSNLNVLEKRHIRFVENNIEIRAFDPVSRIELEIISDVLAGIAVNSIVAAKNIAGDGAAGCDLVLLTETVGRFRAGLRNSD